LKQAYPSKEIKQQQEHTADSMKNNHGRYKKENATVSSCNTKKTVKKTIP
jgi:hypothetical protein